MYTLYIINEDLSETLILTSDSIDICLGELNKDVSKSYKIEQKIPGGSKIIYGL